MKKVSDKIIHRAVDLWCKKLHTPVFDNGDDSANGGMSMALASINIMNDKPDDMESKVEVFRKSLTDNLITARDESDYFDSLLSVDYGPCKSLAEAADIAGIPGSQFSCKSTVYMSEDFVGVSFGYGAEDINHYPLPDGGWLKTTLRGSDINLVIDSISNGNPLDMDVEQAACKVS